MNDYHNFRKKTPRRIHKTKNLSIWISSHGESRSEIKREKLITKRENLIKFLKI